MTQTNETIEGFEESSLATYYARLDAETDKYLAAYDAACSLAIFVELIEAGYPPRKGGVLVEDAKEKLRKLTERDGSDFFTRFERVK